MQVFKLTTWRALRQRSSLKDAIVIGGRITWHPPVIILCDTYVVSSHRKDSNISLFCFVSTYSVLWNRVFVNSFMWSVLLPSGRRSPSPSLIILPHLPDPPPFIPPLLTLFWLLSRTVSTFSLDYFISLQVVYQLIFLSQHILI